MPSGDLGATGGGERGRRNGEPAWMCWPAKSSFLVDAGEAGAVGLTPKRLLRSLTTLSFLAIKEKLSGERRIEDSACVQGEASEQRCVRGAGR